MTRHTDAAGYDLAEAIDAQFALRNEEPKRPATPTPARPPIPLEQLLEFENRWTGRHGPARDEAIRKTFNLPAIRYYQQLHHAIRTEAAVALDPMLCRHLVDELTTKTAARQSRTYERGSR
jgi:hypothetical protein